MEPFKNLYNKNFVIDLANYIEQYENNFQKDEYINHVFKDLESLELKDRMRLISSSFHPFLNTSYSETIDILDNAKKHFAEGPNVGLQLMVFQDYVEVYGLDDFDTSMRALKLFTINSSSEFAIRHFIIKYEEKAIKQMKLWAKSDNEHIRRLSSEGCRPRLPWGVALSSFKKDPNKILEILEILKHDDSLYVRKSVANNLNDISKDNPEKLIKFVEENLGFSKNLDWICKHASRTLLKAGDKRILELFGYKKDDSLIIKDFKIDEIVKVEENLNFSFNLETANEKIGNVRIEYAIDYLKSNGALSRKVFMLNQSEIKQNSKFFKKYQSFKTVTTRKYYKGLHQITIIINGEEKIMKEFELK